MRRLACLSALILAAASARAQSAPPKSPSSDPPKLGVYALEVTTEDGTLVGQLSVKPSTDKSKENVLLVLSVGDHAPETKSFAREGSGYVLIAGHEEFTITYKLSFAGDSLSGSFKMSSGTTGTIVGALKH